MSVDRRCPDVPTDLFPLSSAEKIGWMATVCREALGAPTLQEALDCTVRGVVERAGYYSCSIGLLDGPGRRIVNRAWFSRGSQQIPPGYAQTVGQGVVSRAVRGAEPVLVPDVRVDPDYVALFPEVRSEICFPLRIGEQMIGVLDVNSDQVDDFDGEGRWLLETLSGLLVQIIDKNRLFQEVTETRDYLEALIAAAGDAIITTDLEGRTRGWNRAAEQMFGYSRAEMEGEPLSRLWHPEDAAAARNLFQRVLSGEVVEEHESRRLHKDGRVVDVVLTLSPIHDAAGEVVGVGSIVRDVSEKRRMEARFVEMHRRIAASEEKYRSLVEHAQEAIFLVDPDGLGIREANPCASSLTQRSAERLAAMRWPELAVEEDAEDARRHLERAIASGAAAAREIRLERPDGADLILEITASAVQSAESGFLQVIGRDVTERRRAEDEREAMRDRLLQSEKLSVMGELISGVAHELNNPLTGVIGYAQLLLEQSGGANVGRNVERIQVEARRCHRIVQNLLAFARQRRSEWKATSVNALLEDTLEMRAYQMRVDNIWLVRELDPDLPAVEGDPHQLQQVFVNLMTNAHQSLASTGRGGVLTVSTRRVKDQVMVRFADNGPGIDPEISHRIFEPFFTTKDAGQGTGLGLSLCHGIVQDHGGSIRVTDRPGGDTVFVVELPVASAAGASLDGTDDAAAARPDVQEAERRILVVDDEETILEFVSEALRVRGHDVETAANGLHALDRMRESEYDAVITDLKMPGMSGRQLYEALRREYPEMAARVIFATGDLVARDTMSFLESTGNTYLEKPFSIRSIAEALIRLEDQSSESSPGR